MLGAAQAGLCDGCGDGYGQARWSYAHRGLDRQPAAGAGVCRGGRFPAESPDRKRSWSLTVPAVSSAATAPGHPGGLTGRGPSQPDRAVNRQPTRRVAVRRSGAARSSPPASPSSWRRVPRALSIGVRVARAPIVRRPTRYRDRRLRGHRGPDGQPTARAGVCIVGAARSLVPGAPLCYPTGHLRPEPGDPPSVRATGAAGTDERSRSRLGPRTRPPAPHHQQRSAVDRPHRARW